MAHGSVNPQKTWARAGQVDLSWTNICGNKLTWGLRIGVKVMGNELLYERTDLVLKLMHYNGYFDQTRFPVGAISPTTLRENCLAQG